MQTAVAESWGVPTNAGAYDPLLASLVHVTGLLGRPWSAEALSAGLPVPETGLTPELFVRAAARTKSSGVRPVSGTGNPADSASADHGLPSKPVTCTRLASSGSYAPAFVGTPQLSATALCIGCPPD